MRRASIVAGGIYHDDKHSVREVVALDASSNVRYRILAARQTRGYDYATGTYGTSIGTEVTVTLAAFANWAKRRLDATAAASLIRELEADRVRLSTGERAFMNSVVEEGGNLSLLAGTRLSYEHTEGRAVAGLAKKGMVIRHAREVELTELGSAWVRRAIGRHQDANTNVGEPVGAGHGN